MVETKTATKSAAKKTSSVSKQPLSHAIGRRKKAVARVWLKRGKGAISVNGRKVEEYFDTDITRLAATMPFRVLPISSNYDVHANVTGGGLWGQADAVKLGIARAFATLDEAARPVLRQHGLLTVDARNKERKKYGQKAARRKFQFVKR